MFTAILADRKENLKILIDAGANVNQRDGFGATPAMAAAEVGNYEMAYILLQHGTDPTVVDNAGRDLQALVEAKDTSQAFQSSVANNPYRAKLLQMLGNKNGGGEASGD